LETELCRRILENMSRVIVGKSKSLELLLVALMADGHVLIEDVPGVGKTLMAKCLARSIGGVFKRVQFTPDLLPSDITGFNIYDRKKGGFQFQPGPVMANVLLADEINRTVPRTQASLLESMEERQVTVDGQTFPLPRPFFVMATQNPIELEGTFPLPEAQLDRFLLKIHLGYPDEPEELAILERFQYEDPLLTLHAVAEPKQVAMLQQERTHIRVAPPVREYISTIVRATRVHPHLRFGASPRAALGLMRAAQALAAVRGRDYVLPDDVKSLAHAVLTHRLILDDREQLRGLRSGDILAEVLEGVSVPAAAAAGAQRE
jgi:MoxR-like ATPase